VASLWHRYVPLQSSGCRTRSRRRQYLQRTQSNDIGILLIYYLSLLFSPKMGHSFFKLVQLR
jgi:hypothetical protein